MPWCAEHQTYSRCDCHKKARAAAAEPDPADAIQLGVFSQPVAHNGTAQSIRAAERLTPDKLNERQRQCFRVVWKYRFSGVTHQRTEEEAGLDGSTVRPRFGELWRDAWIEARDRETGAPIEWHPDRAVRAERLGRATEGVTRAGNGAALWYPTRAAEEAVESERARKREAAA